MVARIASDSAVISVDAIVDVLKAIADPTRFHLLHEVSERKGAVGQLAELVGAHVAVVSQHLAKLRAAGLVTARRDGTPIFYGAANSRVVGVVAEAGLLAGHVTTRPPAVMSSLEGRWSRWGGCAWPGDEMIGRSEWSWPPEGRDA